MVIEAIQFTGSNYFEVMAFMGVLTAEESPIVCIKTLEGMMTAKIGDYVIKGVQGEFYPCKPDIFNKTYEEVI